MTPADRAAIVRINYHLPAGAAGDEVEEAIVEAIEGAVRAERDECARLCEVQTCARCAAAIRARKE